MQTSKTVVLGCFRPNYTLYDEEETGNGFERVEKRDEPHQHQSCCGSGQTTSRPAANAGGDGEMVAIGQ
tara:strand:- start:1227 stop:1433 length:207 start_codon:yes stop_codon:yes gene_type:complete